MSELLRFLWDLLCGPEENQHENEVPVTVPPQFPVGTLFKEIPLCGNSWVTSCSADRSRSGAGEEELTEDGCGNWTCPSTIWSIFFRMSKSETITVYLRLRIPPRSRSILKCSLADDNNGNNSGVVIIGSNGCGRAGGVGGEGEEGRRGEGGGGIMSGKGNTGRSNTPCYEINIVEAAGGEYQNILVGQFHIQEAGYVKFNLQGIMRTGEFYAQVSHLLLAHTQSDNEILFNTEQDSYFGRRGPSVHLSYQLPPPHQFPPTEYFYNEVIIPPGSDALGLYAMAIGFQGGYFGIQVNSPEERRVLFSIWSEFNTDDPSHIPQDYQVQLIRKGRRTHVGQFGNEGSGAQSYMKFKWEAGSIYKFLVHVKPLDDQNTLYEAWFLDSPGQIENSQWRAEDSEGGKGYCGGKEEYSETEEHSEGKQNKEHNNNWQLIASFKKPKVSMYLQGVYSFLENFEPDHGHLERVACYGNQWARDCEGLWHPITKARFTGDATSKAGRRDFAGGLVQGVAVVGGEEDGGKDFFYLKHCGFFSDFVPTEQNFSRCGKCEPPDVDVTSLP